MGVKSIIVFLNKIDLVADPEMHELVEMEVRELLTHYEFDGEKTLFIKGSALHALNGTEPEIGEKAIEKLVQALDTEIPVPERLKDKSFLMSIDST